MTNMTIDELKDLLKSLGGNTRGNLKRENLIKRIEALQKTASRPGEPSAIESVLGLTAKPIEAKKPIGGCSQEEVLEALKNNRERGMVAKFEGNTWHFSRKGREDSGTMSQPISNIIKCANAVCQEVAKATATGDPARYAQ